MTLLERGATQRAIAVWPSTPDGTAVDAVAQEFPVALIYNGISHIVMMASPVQLEAFALGFSLTEGIIDSPEELYGIDVVWGEGSAEVSLSIATRKFEAFKQVRRGLAGRSGCGICGKESLQQIHQTLAPVEGAFTVSHRAIQAATRGLSHHQPLQQQTGSVHGAAWCALDGEVVMVCEDVGRHNALDKLVGCLWSDNCFDKPGFLLMSSRASFEIVQKAAKAGIALVVTLSAPTSMAIEIAENVGMTLVGFSRAHRHVAYSHAHRLQA